jgi:carbamoyltransferase
MYILGISFGFHDSSVALINNGILVSAVSEERFSRVKNDSSFPKKAVEYTLLNESISIDDIDKIVYYEDNLLKLNRIVEFSQYDGQEYFNQTLNSWIEYDRLDIKSKIANLLQIDRSKIYTLKHHLSHIGSAFYPSGFSESAILTIDGVGEYETVTISKGKENTIELVDTIELPNSLGLFYSAYTSFLGFEVNEGEYKVMGMAPYGKPIYRDKILKTIDIDYVNKSFCINEKYFKFRASLTKLYTEKLEELFGEPREPNMPFFTPEYMNLAPIELSIENQRDIADKNLYYANIAASLQDVTQDIILLLVEKTIDLVPSKNLCISGGVALNSVANGKIRESFNGNLFIQPSAGDSGSSLGAALYYYHHVLGNKREWSQNSALLGEKLFLSSIEEDINNNLFEEKVDHYNDLDEYLEQVSDLLIEGNVVGWVNGKFEFGPRALGSRSILADPRKEEMKLIVNEKIKFREPFRPFAPSVLYEEAHKWFNIKEDLPANAPENFMLTVCTVKDDKKGLIPAIVHTDGTARVQLVREDINPNYYRLIKNFYEKTGVPLILNTSFNLKGEPLVRTAQNAIRTFSYSEMDYLAMFPYVIHSFWNQSKNESK